jgi:hypothetical protein
MKNNSILAAALFALAMIGVSDVSAGCSGGTCSTRKCGTKKTVRMEACPLGYAHDKDYGCLDYSGYTAPDCDDQNSH